MFNISLSGERQAVIRDIQAAKAVPPTEEDPQLESLKVFLVSEISGLAPEFNGVRVNASGEANKNVRTATVNLSGLKLSL